MSSSVIAEEFLRVQFNHERLTAAHTKALSSQVGSSIQEHPYLSQEGKRLIDHNLLLEHGVRVVDSGTINQVPINVNRPAKVYAINYGQVLLYPLRVLDTYEVAQYQMILAPGHHNGSTKRLHLSADGDPVCSIFGNLRTAQTIILAESLTKAAAIFQAFNADKHKVAVVNCVNAGGMVKIAKELSSCHGERMVVACDNDAKHEQGLLPQLAKMLQETGLKWTNPQQAKDWDDLLENLDGLALIREAISQAKTLVSSADNEQPENIFHYHVGSSGFGSSQQYLIKGLVPENSFGVVFGQSGAGKSFHTIDWACSIASGLPWDEHRVIAGAVVYVAAEGGTGMSNRIRAWEMEHNQGQPIANLFTIREPVHVTLVDQVRRLSKTIEHIETKNQVNVVLVVLDTLARCFAGADENRAADMNLFIAGCDQVRTKNKCSLLVVHHSGKGSETDARGSSALKAAADFEYAVLKPEDRDGYVLKCTKAKDMELCNTTLFKFKKVTLGKDADGDPITTLVSTRKGISFDHKEPNKNKSHTHNHEELLEAITHRCAGGEEVRVQLIRDDLKSKGIDVKNLGRWVSKLERDNIISNNNGSLRLVHH